MIRNPNDIQDGAKKIRMLIAGYPGIGKSTLALSAPRPLHIDCDFGIDRIEPRYRMPYIQPRSYDEILNDLKPENLNDFETLVFDTAGKLISLMGLWAIKQNPKYGQRDGSLSLKGYGFVGREFVRLMDYCFYELKKNIVVVFHATEEKDGDNTRLRIKVEGQTKNNVWEPMDLGGFVEMYGNDRTMTADEGMDDDEADSEGKDDDEADSGEKDDDEAASEDDAKRRKSAAFRRQVKSGTAPAQRKYSSLFMGGTASAKKQQKSVPPLVNLARAIKCLDVFGRHDPERAEFYAKKYYEDMSMAREFKAMSATNPTAGGFLIPEVYLDEVIELLYSKTIIKELGARTIPLENGNLNIPRMTSGTRAMWGGEGRKIASTQPAFGNLRLSAKRLEAIVPQTRELMMSTKYSADELFAADLSRRMQLGLDWGALYGTGGEFQPTGIANTPGVEKIDAKKMDAQYAADGRLTADFPVYVKSLVMSKNVDDQALGWAFNSFMEGYLKNIKTTTGDYIYRDEMNAGNFLGMPYKVSNQIPTNSKTGCTEMFFGNWADLMIGDQMGLETYTTLDGTWTDENGVQHNAFEENLTSTRALMYDDIGVRHVESFAYVHNIKVI